MNRKLAFACVLGTLLACWAVAAPAATPASGPSAAAKDLPAEPAAWDEGKLKDVAPVVSKFLALTWDNGTLRLDRDHWKVSYPAEKKAEGEDANNPAGGAVAVVGARVRFGGMGGGNTPDMMFYRELQAQAGGGGSSMSMGGNTRSMSFTGGGLSASISMGESSVKVLLREESGPERTVEFSDDGGGTLRIRVSDGEGERFLIYRQESGGKVKLTEVDGDRVYSLRADKFQDLYTAHRAYIDQRVFPMLAAMGITPPANAGSPAVRGAVLDRLRGPMTDAEKAEVQALLAALDGDSYKDREAAAKRLTAGAVRWHDLLEAHTRKEGLAAGTSDRLKKILDERAEEQKVASTVSALGLLQDVDFLIALLADSKGDADRQAVAAHLAKLTGQTLGPDPAAWQQWRRANPAWKPTASAPAR